MSSLPKSLFVVMVCLGFSIKAHALEILIHSGPTVSTPDAELYSPEMDQSKTKELLFQYEFLIDYDKLKKLPDANSDRTNIAISAIRAIQLASSSVEVGDNGSLNVIRLELLTRSDKLIKPNDYYLITFILNGSEVHRVVLMDGSVLKPTLRRLDKKTGP